MPAQQAPAGAEREAEEQTAGQADADRRLDEGRAVITPHPTLSYIESPDKWQSMTVENGSTALVFLRR